VRQNALHVLEPRAGAGEQVLADGQEELAADERTVLVDEEVERGPDATLDRVLDREERRVHLAAPERRVGLGEAGVREGVAAAREVAAKDGLLAEGAGRAEVGDAHADVVPHPARARGARAPS